MDNSHSSADVAAMDDVYRIAMERGKEVETRLRSEMEAVRVDAEARGILKTLAYQDAQNQMIRAAVFYRVHQAKTYKSLGLTWAQFCEANGTPVETVRDWLRSLRPVFEAFSAKTAEICGYEPRKIKYLGEAFSAKTAENSNGDIIYKGERFSFTSEGRDDFQALLDRIEEDAKREAENHTAAIKAKERLLASKEDVITKQEREITRLSQTVDFGDMTPEEIDAIQMLQKFQTEFQLMVSAVKKKIHYKTAPVSALRHLYFLYLFIGKIACDERLDMNEHWSDAAEVPWEIMEDELPPPDVMVDNLPLTRGMGKAYRQVAARRANKGQ